jgi:hypothetical protein
MPSWSTSISAWWTRWPVSCSPCSIRQHRAKHHRPAEKVPVQDAGRVAHALQRAAERLRRSSFQSSSAAAPEPEEEEDSTWARSRPGRIFERGRSRNAAAASIQASSTRSGSADHRAAASRSPDLEGSAMGGAMLGVGAIFSNALSDILSPEPADRPKQITQTFSPADRTPARSCRTINPENCSPARRSTCCSRRAFTKSPS